MCCIRLINSFLLTQFGLAKRKLARSVLTSKRPLSLSSLYKNTTRPSVICTTGNYRQHNTDVCIPASFVMGTRSRHTHLGLVLYSHPRVTSWLSTTRLSWTQDTDRARRRPKLIRRILSPPRKGPRERTRWVWRTQIQQTGTSSLKTIRTNQPAAAGPQL